MIIKLTQLIAGYSVLAEILNNKEDKVPTKFAYALARNIRLMEPEIKTYEGSRMAIFKDLGKHIEKTESTPEQWEAGDNLTEISSRLNDLLSEEVELNLHQLKLEDAGETIIPAHMLALDWMFIEE